ncbi:MAG: hemerythrin domain-containing protein [Myxococcales bacterium]
MRLQIAGFAPAERDEDAVGLLLACHARIRYFTDVARRIAEGPALPPEQLRDAAARVRRYFDEALPLHAEDEDQSLAPRLLALQLTDELRTAVETMVRQHGPIDETLAALVPHWRTLEQEPSRQPALAAELRQLTAALQAHWDEHLALEEEVVFPAVRRLLEVGEQRQVLKELRARRAPRAR